MQNQYVTYEKDGIIYTGKNMDWAQQYYKRAKASGEHQIGINTGRTHDMQHLEPVNMNYRTLPDHHLSAQDKEVVKRYTTHQAPSPSVAFSAPTTSMPTSQPSQPARSPISNLNK